ARIAGMGPKAAWRLMVQAFNEWSDAKAPTLGAALAYYSILSLAPLLILVLAIASLIFVQDAAQGHLVDQIKGTFGERSAAALQDMLKNSYYLHSGLLATMISAAMLLIGASAVFAQLQDALNTIWKVAPKPGRTFAQAIRDRLFSFLMVLGTG